MMYRISRILVSISLIVMFESTALGETQNAYKGFDIYVDVDNQDLYASVMRSFAEEHAFAIYIQPKLIGEHLLIQLFQEEVKIYSVKRETGIYSIHFYRREPAAHLASYLDRMIEYIRAEFDAARIGAGPVRSGGG